MTTCLPWTVRRRHWDLGQIYAFQQVLIVQPSERGQFLVGVDYDLMAGPARSVRSSRQHRCSIAEVLLVLLLLRMMRMVMVGGMVIAAATVASGDDHVVIEEVVLLLDDAAHVHLFRGQQDNVADAVHAVRGGYIILAEMSLLQYDQFGRGRGRRGRVGGRWRHDRRRRRRRCCRVAMDRC